MSRTLSSLHIRGESAYALPASPRYLWAAGICDLGIGSIVFCATLMVLRASPVPHAWMIPAFLAELAAIRVAQRLHSGLTLGERVWALRVDEDRKLFFPKLKQCSPVPSSTLGLGSFLTLLSVIAGYCILIEAMSLHPLGRIAVRARWLAFLPPLDQAAASGDDRWAVTPFFFSLGAWPKTFRGKDVFYTLPYEKGPPARFAGEIIARWSMPEIRVAFEGPKTPLNAEKMPYSRAEVETCVADFWDRSWFRIPSCLELREAVLQRHIDALKALHPVGWSLKWIQVDNSALPPEEQVQGIYLSAWDPKTAQDRFILVTAKGTEQTFILNYPLSPEGSLAQDAFQKAIRSLRVSDDLAPGRAWVDQNLERVHLQDLDKIGPSTDVISRLAEIQALLISRISVDPKTYDTYFHLAGTALMLARYARQIRSQPGSDAKADQISEWIAIAKPLVQAAYRYAVDISPDEKRTPMLQNYWFEAQKL